MSEYLKTAENVGDINTGNVSSGETTSGQLSDIAASGVSAYKTLNSVTTEQIDISTTGQKNNSSLSDYDSIYINDFKNLLNDLYTNFRNAGLSIADYNSFCEEYLYGKDLYEILDATGKIKDEIVLKYSLKLFLKEEGINEEIFENCKTKEEVTERMKLSVLNVRGLFSGTSCSEKWEKFYDSYDQILRKTAIKDLHINDIQYAFLNSGFNLDYYYKCMSNKKRDDLLQQNGNIKPLVELIENVGSSHGVFENEKRNNLNATLTNMNVIDLYSQKISEKYHLSFDDYLELMGKSYDNKKDKKEAEDTFYKTLSEKIEEYIKRIRTQYSHTYINEDLEIIGNCDEIIMWLWLEKLKESSAFNEEHNEEQFILFYNYFIKNGSYDKTFNSNGEFIKGYPSGPDFAYWREIIEGEEFRLIYKTLEDNAASKTVKLFESKEPGYYNWEIAEVVQAECGLSAIVFETPDGYAIDIACANENDGGGDTTTITYPLLKSLFGDENLANYLGPLLYGDSDKPENINADYASTHTAAQVYSDTMLKGTELIIKYALKAKKENKKLDIFGYSIGGGTALSCYEILKNFSENLPEKLVQLYQDSLNDFELKNKKDILSKYTESELDILRNSVSDLINVINSVTVFNPFMGLLDEIGVDENEIITSINHDEKIKIFRMEYDLPSTCNNYITELNGNRVVTLVTTKSIDYDGMEDDGIKWLYGLILANHHGLIASNEAFDSNGNIINPQKTKSFNQIISEVFNISSYEEGYDPQWFLIAVFNNIISIQQLLLEKTGYVFDTKGIEEALASPDFSVSKVVSEFGKAINNEDGRHFILELMSGHNYYQEMVDAKSELDEATKKWEDDHPVSSFLEGASYIDQKASYLKEYREKYEKAKLAYENREEYNKCQDDTIIGYILNYDNGEFYDTIVEGLLEYINDPENYEKVWQLMCYISWGYYDDAAAEIISMLNECKDILVEPLVDITAQGLVGALVNLNDGDNFAANVILGVLGIPMDIFIYDLKEELTSVLSDSKSLEKALEIVEKGLEEEPVNWFSIMSELGEKIEFDDAPTLNFVLNICNNIDTIIEIITGDDNLVTKTAKLNAVLIDILTDMGKANVGEFTTGIDNMLDGTPLEGFADGFTDGVDKFVGGVGDFVDGAYDSFASGVNTFTDGISNAWDEFGDTFGWW